MTELGKRSLPREAELRSAEFDDLCEACGKHPAKQAGLCGRCLKKLPELDGIADRFREAAESNMQRYLVNIGIPAALRRRVSVRDGAA